MTKMCRNLYSLIVFLLMTTSLNSSNEPVCDFISTEGKMRALGLYRRFDQNGSPSYWLFARDTNETVDTDIEYELSFGLNSIWNVSTEGIPTIRANHKFSGRFENEFYNCSIKRYDTPVNGSNVCYDYN